MSPDTELTTEQLMAIAGPPSGAPTQAPARQSAAPVGVRNQNRGNLKDGPFARSQPGYTGAAGDFATFDTPEAGDRAQENLLASRYLAKGFNTPAAIVNRYAPVGPENSQESVNNYIGHISSRLGIAPNAQVSPDQVATLAQAMREFENGTWQSAGGGTQATPVAPDVPAIHRPEDLDTEALVALAGRPGETEEDPFVITADTPRELLSNLTKGTWINVDGQTRRLAGDAYVNQNGAQGDTVAAGGNAYLHEVDGMDALRAFSTAAGEQIPGLDEAAVGITAAFDPTRDFSQVRDNYRAMQAVDNQTNRGARDLGGIAGAGLTLAAPGGGFVNAGRTGAAQVARAGLLGAGYGAAFGAGNTEGDLGQRAEGALWGAGLGAATGGAMQGLSGLLGRSSARAAAAPLSDARTISQMGVDLTPGQMAGGFLKRMEDGLTSVPVLGDAIRGAQRRGLESFDNAAINRALEPIGTTLTPAQSAGRQGMVAARAAESGAYNNALANVSVDAADPALASSLAALRRSTGLTKDVRSSLNSTLDNILEQAQGVVDGDTWKRVDSQLAAAARAAGKGADSAPEKAVLAQRLTDARTAWRDLLGRSDQAALDAVSQADAASAALRIVRKASSDVGSAARNGDASPQTLNRAVAAGGSDGGAGYSQGSRLLQDLTDPSMRVLPSSVPDSGTALRSMFTLLPTLATGAGAGAVGVPGAALGTALLGTSIAAGSAAYSRPVIGLLNRAYRAKTPGAVRGVIADAERLAAENPAGVQAVLQALSPSPLAEQAQLRERLNRPGGGLLATQGQTQPSLLSQ